MLETCKVLDYHKMSRMTKECCSDALVGLGVKCRENESLRMDVEASETTV